MADVNGFDPAPLAVDGAETPSALFRLGLYASLKDAEGIITPGDLKVSELEIPGTQVRMAIGAAAFLNRSPGAHNQTYVVSASSETRLDVPPTDASGPKSYLVCVRVEDPEFGPFAGPPTEEDEPLWQYVVPFVYGPVPANTTHWSQVGETYSAYATARIDMPVSTGTVIDDYIVDLRQIAQPRRESFFDVAIPGGQQALTSGSWVNWATAANKQLVVPKWATTAILRTTIGGLMSYEGLMWGRVRMRLGAAGGPATVVTPEIKYDINHPVGNGVDRHTLIFGGKVNVPAELLGQSVTLTIEGIRDGGSTGIEVNPESSVFTEVEWIEAAA